MFYNFLTGMAVSRAFSTVKYKNEVSLDCLSINYFKYLKHELELSSTHKSVL